MVPELTTSALVDAFGEEDVRRFDDGEVPAGVAHAGTRRFLTAVGVPTDLKNGFLNLSLFEPLPERHAARSAKGHWTWALPANADQWYVLGGFFGGDVALDGATGEISFIPDGDEPPRPLHSGVDALAYYMYALQRDTYYYSQEYADQVDDDPDDERDGEQALLETALKLARELMDADPTPFTVDELPTEIGDPDEELFPRDFAGPWTGAFIDLSAGEWD
ncbi:SUKH-4 family immunity protein [Spirillospora sp. NPDC052242]